MDPRVLLRPAAPHELTALWEAAYGQLDWKEFDGPYFPWKAPTLEEFERKSFPRFLEGTEAQIIEIDGHIAGQVVSYWEYEATRWLEVGIALYSSSRWGRGVGRRALAQWVTLQFQTHEVERVGLTTWSGNERMMRCALAAGLRLEARFRKCRYYNGVYYDSVSYGVLRDEWFADGLHVPHAEARPMAVTLSPDKRIEQRAPQARLGSKRVSAVHAHRVRRTGIVTCLLAKAKLGVTTNRLPASASQPSPWRR